MAILKWLTNSHLCSPYSLSAKVIHIKKTNCLNLFQLLCTPNKVCQRWMNHLFHNFDSDRGEPVSFSFGTNLFQPAQLLLNTVWGLFHKYIQNVNIACWVLLLTFISYMSIVLFLQKGKDKRICSFLSLFTQLRKNGE